MEVSWNVVAALIAGCAVTLQTSAVAQETQVSLPEVVVRPPASIAQRPPEAEFPDLLPDGVLLNGGPPPRATTAGPVSGYRALTAVSATRTETAVERIPQTIVVIPRSVIDDQISLTPSEALRNVAGTTGMPTTFLNGANYKVRGFDAERYIDGLPNYIDAGDYTSLVNTERIEVIKGPGGLLFQSGGGVTGGVINTISKLPRVGSFVRAGVKAGGPGLWNPWFDVNHSVTGNARFRMTGEFERSGDQIEVIERQRYSFNPTISLSGDASTLTIQGRASRRIQQTYVGLPGAGTLDTSKFAVQRNLYVGPSDIPRAASENNGIAVRFDHTVNDIWSFNTAARYSQIRQNDYAQTFLGLTPDMGTSFVMSNLASPWSARELAINANAIARFTVGDIKSSVLLAADYDRVEDSLSIWSGFAGLTDFAAPSPVFASYTDPTGVGTRVFDTENTNVNGGLVAQIQATVWDRLHFVTGLRWASVDFLGSQPFTGSQYHTVKRKLLPKFGVAFDLLDGVTPFASYSEGLRAVRFFTGSGTPKAEEARQIETGVKIGMPGGLSATLAVFDIVRQNVVSTDPNNPLLQIQTGEQRSRGFDAAIVWQPMAGLSVLASYAYTDARITEDTLLPAGNWLDRVPRHTGRLWANYTFQEGPLANLSIGAGFHTASEQAINLENDFFTPGFITFDAKVSYETERWSIGVIGKNLTNNHYFIPYPYAQGRVAPGEPLTVLGFATLKR